MAKKYAVRKINHEPTTYYANKISQRLSEEKTREQNARVITSQ